MRKLKLKKRGQYKIINEYGREWLAEYQGFTVVNRMRYYKFEILNGYYVEPKTQWYSENYIFKNDIEITEIEEWEKTLLMLDKQNQKRGKWRVDSFD